MDSEKYQVDNDNNDDDKNHLSNTDVGAQWYYFVNSNNGEIPEDELNYQTNNINSIEAISTIKWKILVRRLRLGNDSDYTLGFTIVNYDINSGNNNEYNRDTIHDSIQAEDINNYVVNDSSMSNRCSDNYEDGCVDITSANKVKYLEWYMQKYQVDNGTKLDWILKWYQVDNVYKSKYGNTKFEWRLKKYRVDNMNFDQKKELKRCDHTDKNKEDQVYWMPDPLDRLNSVSSIPIDPLDHLDSISPKQDMYSNKH